jgi:hypothetical protein
MEHPMTTHHKPTLLHVVDAHGDRFIVVFPCKRCGGNQAYAQQDDSPHCPNCDLERSGSAPTAV